MGRRLEGLIGNNLIDCPFCHEQHYFENDYQRCLNKYVFKRLSDAIVEEVETEIEVLEDSDISNPPEWADDHMVIYSSNNPDASWNLPK